MPQSLNIPTPKGTSVPDVQDQLAAAMAKIRAMEAEKASQGNGLTPPANHLNAEPARPKAVGTPSMGITATFKGQTLEMPNLPAKARVGKAKDCIQKKWNKTYKVWDETACEKCCGPFNPIRHFSLALNALLPLDEPKKPVAIEEWQGRMFLGISTPAMDSDDAQYWGNIVLVGVGKSTIQLKPKNFLKLAKGLGLAKAGEYVERTIPPTLLAKTTEE